MKIALITQQINTRSGSRAPIELAIHLGKIIKVDVFSYDSNLDKKVKNQLEENKNINLYTFPGNTLLNKLRSSQKLISLLKKSEYDLISFHAALPLFLTAWFSRIPIIKTYYGTQLNGYLERKLPNQKINTSDRILNLLGNFWILTSDKIQFLLSQNQIAISHYTAREAEILYNSKIPVVYLGANTLNSKQTKKKNSYSAGNRSLNILSVSRITPYKGFHQLISIIKKVSKKYQKPIKLTIAGSSPSRSYLKYLKTRANPKIKILTNIPDKKLSSLYFKTDIYATCDRYLFFGMPILEASLFKKPSIALDYCAARELILHGETGFVASDLDQFENLLLKMINSKTLRRKMGQAAHQQAAIHFNWQNTAKAYKKLFDTYSKNE